MQSNSSDVAQVEELGLKYAALKKEIGKVIIGQDEVIHLLLLSVFCRGHSLLVGVPGLAKTLLVNTVSEALGLSFQRIQFTPDLMPSDIVGSEVLDENRRFKFVKGPIFSNIILADEINRTPPKTQSALLEAMQERSVTAGGNTYKMAKPFFVLATQNPIEQEGTYPLPEAQLDRFMFNIEVGYPSFEEEVNIVKNTTTGVEATVNEVLTIEEILKFQALVRKIPVSDHLYEFAIRLVQATRPNTPAAKAVTQEYLSWGAGPRASQNLILAAKAHAALKGKFSPDTEDILAVAKPILRHRVVKNYRAEAEGISIEKIIEGLV
jgi:MoxR-like ATPase